MDDNHKTLHSLAQSSDIVLNIPTTTNKRTVKTEHYRVTVHTEELCTGVDPGYFLGGGAPLRNGVTDFNTNIFFLQNTSCIRKLQVFSWGGGGGGRHPQPLPRSALMHHKNISKLIINNYYKPLNLYQTVFLIYVCLISCLIQNPGVRKQETIMYSTSCTSILHILRL